MSATLNARAEVSRVAGVDASRAIALLGIGALIVLAFWVRDDVGITIDEALQARYGRRILSWFASGFSDRRALSFGGTMMLYGGLFDSVAQLLVRVSPLGVWGTRHFATALCAIGGIVATWKIAARLGGPRAGLAGALVLVFTPIWLGHGMFNPKDIPFACAAAWSVFGTLNLLQEPTPPSWRATLLCGASIGATLGVRSGGMFVLGYPVAAVVSRLWLSRHAMPAAEFREAAAASCLRLVACVALAWAVMLLAWPWAQIAPLRHPLEAAWLAAHFRWGGDMLFDGAFVSSLALPRSYLPTWFAVSLPETYLLGALCAPVVIVLALRRQRYPRIMWLSLAAVACAAFGPLLAAVIARPALYDAQRHFLFLLPPMAALAGWALAEFLTERALPQLLRSTVLGMLVGLLAVISADIVMLHPYEYVYFNRLSGGLPGALGRFETDYWGASYTEGMAWTFDHLAHKRSAPWKIGSCNDSDEVRFYLERSRDASRHFQFVRNPAEAEIFLATTRFNCHQTKGEVLHVVRRMGVPLLYVIAREPETTAQR